jgi:VanZ family protein
MDCAKRIPTVGVMLPEARRTRWSRVAPWLPPVTVGYWCLLAILTHWPRRHPFPPRMLYEDKLAHFLAYSGLAFLISLTLHAGTLWRRGTASPRLARMGIALVVVMLYGVVDELTQPWFGRNCELADWFADLGGALVGLTASWFTLRYISRSTASAASDLNGGK